MGPGPPQETFREYCRLHADNFVVNIIDPHWSMHDEVQQHTFDIARELVVCGGKEQQVISRRDTLAEFSVYLIPAELLRN